jgi:polyisoprenoid-binding protein YceI
MPKVKICGRFFVTGVIFVAVAGLFSLSASSAGGGPAAAVRYRLDAGQSRFMVKVFVGGFLKAFGHDHNIAIRDFTGEIQATPDSITPASLQMTIKADSLAVTDKVSESDRKKIETTMREEVLETRSYPEIVFKSTNAAVAKTGEGKYDFKLWGELFLHGVKGDTYIVGKMTLDGNTLRATGGFPLYLSNYKMKQVSVAGGTIKVKDEIKFSFDLVARRL